MSRSRRATSYAPALLALLAVVPSVAGVARVLELTGGGEVTAANARFFASPFPVTLHILAVVPYGLLGALQLTPAVRRRWPTWHRVAGRYLAALGLVGAFTGLWMTHFYPWPEGDGVALYLLRSVFGSAMVASIVLGIEAARRRDFASHGAWMLRGYAIGMGAGTQVLTHLPWLVAGVWPGESLRAVLMGAGWVVNLALAELVIRLGRSPRNVIPRLA